jgi:glycosyltransferase involved in cell wall biosynthesis
MNSPSPKVSVFMPVYNAGSYLYAAIDSILNQSFTDFEFVIVNDGSTDQSESVILSYNDPRIRLVNNPKNLGLIASLNVGLEICNGEYIVRMDQDDISLPDRIALQVSFMEQNPEIGLIGSWFEDFGDQIESKIVRYSTNDTEIRIRHLYQTHISHPTALLRSSIVRRHNIRFDPEYVHGEDYNCWVTMSAFCKLSNYPAVLVRKRDHPRNITNSFSSTMHSTCTKVKQKQFEAMGSAVSQAEADLYTRFADPEWGFSLVEMNQLLNLLHRLNAANTHSKFIQPDEYAQYLAGKWFHLCFHNMNLGRSGWNWFKKLVFHQHYQPSFFSSTRFRLRNLGLPL